MSLYKYDGTSINPIDGSYISVTDFGAIGDGVTDDTQAIQATLDAKRENGGTIYFPAKTYVVTSSVFFYSNQYLLFEKGAKILQGAGIDNLLMTYCADGVEGFGGTHDCVIDGAIFDGGPTYETNNTLVGTVHAKNIIIKNCTFINAYGSWHNLEINSSYNVKVINCEFEGTRKTTKNGCLIQIDGLGSSATWPWTNRGVIDRTPADSIEITGCLFRDSSLAPAIGNHSSSKFYNVDIHDNVFKNILSTRGVIIFNGNSNNCRISNNVYDGCPIKVGAVTTDTIIGDYLISELKMLSDLIFRGSYSITVDEIEPGSWAYASKSQSDARLRLCRLFPVKQGMTVSYINPSWKIFIGGLASNTASEYVSGGSGWQNASSSSGSYTIPNGAKYINIILETTDQSNADIANYDCTITLSMSN